MKCTTPNLLAVLASAALASVALVGCASTTTPADASGSGPTASATTAASTSTAPTTTAPQTTAPTTAPTTAAPTPTFPTGQPPRPGRQDQYPNASTVPGLTAAISAAEHPGLQICDGDLASLVTASGDLRGDGGTQYLVDTTCSLATGSSPDEVALYDVHRGTTARSAVLSEFTANRPKPSSYPYLWEGHTVVLAYDQGTRYRLIQLTPDAVVPGVVQAFR
ncbi:hypothetical protein [Curtobacterium flaccumfaciens]|uniref:hypothetical protein n=1 Tax=Curtobacterium flaccumfaciens TaxID=2035 RepID=UPI00106002F3|nr:hypothetical protein [Curtobacterium flaccumfaciens]